MFRRSTGTSTPRSKKGFFSRLFRGVFSIVILSAFMLGIIYAVKYLYGFDSTQVAKKVAPYLAKLHINVSDTDAEKAGEVAGEFVERISQTNLGSGVSTKRELPEEETYAFAVMSDIHNDLASLALALDKAKAAGVSTVILLGDLTDFGDIESLTAAKSVLDSSGMQYYVIPGDHDIAQTSNEANFSSVFGAVQTTVNIAGTNVLLFDNAANFTAMPAERLVWFRENIADVNLVFLSQPLYSVSLNPPFNRLYMGSTSDDKEEDLKLLQDQVLAQRNEMLGLIRTSPNVLAVISGDHHKSSTIKDAENPALTHYVVGAVASEFGGIAQKAVQTSRFSLVQVSPDKQLKITDILLD